MLVIVSDLHLTDGTQCTSLSTEVLALFVQRLSELAMAASHRAGGGYQPIEEIDLLLLGDVFDCIRSAHWLNGDARPWSDPHSPEFIHAITHVTHDILRANQPSLQILRSLSHLSAIQLPPGTQSGTVDYEAEPIPVTVRLFYLVGNRDWFYHLPGPQFDRLRATLVEQLGLENRTDQPFPHDPAESEPIMETMRRHKVWARHGDIYDPFSFEKDRNASSLGDAFAIELMGRFVSEMEHELGADLPQPTIAAVREIENVRPALLIPVWIERVLESTCPYRTPRAKVKAIWDRRADHFLGLDFVRSRDAWHPIDLVDGLARLLKFSKRLKTDATSTIGCWPSSAWRPDDRSYLRYALAEHDFRKRRAKHIVYGHTSFAETKPAEASKSYDLGLDRLYFHAGGWRRFYPHEPQQQANPENIAAGSMTCLSFFQSDERGSRPYEPWSGTLGLGDRSHSASRLDAAHGQAPTPHVLLDQPGFRPSYTPVSR